MNQNSAMEKHALRWSWDPLRDTIQIQTTRDLSTSALLEALRECIKERNILRESLETIQAQINCLQEEKLRREALVVPITLVTHASTKSTKDEATEWWKSLPREERLRLLREAKETSAGK